MHQYLKVHTFLNVLLLPVEAVKLHLPQLAQTLRRCGSGPLLVIPTKLLHPLPENKF